MKIISLIVRRPDLDRVAFADHYDNRHAPLALGLLPARFAAYRRNHVIEPEESSFDCISEFCPPAGAVGVWALSRADPIASDEADACVHHRVIGVSRADATPWTVLSALWYADAAARERDRMRLQASGVASEVVRIRESVSVPGA